MSDPGTPNRVRRLLILSAAAMAIAIAIRLTHNRAVSQPTITDLRQAVRDHPNDAQPQLELGAALLAQHQIGEAEEACKAAVMLAPRDARPLNALARIAIADHHTSDALGYLQASLKIREDDAAVWRTYGVMLQKQNPEAAWQALSRATELENTEAARLIRTGYQEMKRMQNIRGLRDIQRAADMNPDDLVTEVNLGAALIANNQPSLASQAYAHALAMSPGNPLALEGSAAATIQVDQSPAALDRAGQQLDISIASSPTADAYKVRGQLNLIRRHYIDAISDLKTALRIDPKLYTVHSLLYQCYAATGNTRLAHAEASTFVAVDPDLAKPEPAVKVQPDHEYIIGHKDDTIKLVR
jgi:Tfp pilus assembly protein PilF